ncbi:hypothetical protein C8J41_10672 [Sphingomonas sp. PP-CC-3G-468]|nr:hypothetical protein C8J41_10672 [Sphingomonas sp. PP-CC-3G-468]
MHIFTDRKAIATPLYGNANYLDFDTLNPTFSQVQRQLN